MKTDKRLIIIPDFMIALKAIKDNEELSVTDLHHETRITYAHLHTLKQLFVKKGWIQIFEEGVKHILAITDKGKHIVEGVDELLIRLEISDKNLLEFRARTKHGWKKKRKEITKEVEEQIEEETPVVNSYAGVKIENREPSPIETSPGAQLTPEETERMEALERSEVKEARELEKDPVEEAFKADRIIDEETMQEGVDVQHEEVTEDNSFPVDEPQETEIIDGIGKTPEEQIEQVNEAIDKAVNEEDEDVENGEEDNQTHREV